MFQAAGNENKNSLDKMAATVSSSVDSGNQKVIAQNFFSILSLTKC
jgi:hypothetical protein